MAIENEDGPFPAPPPPSPPPPPEPEPGFPNRTNPDKTKT